MIDQRFLSSSWSQTEKKEELVDKSDQADARLLAFFFANKL